MGWRWERRGSSFILLQQVPWEPPAPGWGWAEVSAHTLEDGAAHGVFPSPSGKPSEASALRCARLCLCHGDDGDDVPYGNGMPALIQPLTPTSFPSLPRPRCFLKQPLEELICSRTESSPGAFRLSYNL